MKKEQKQKIKKTLKRMRDVSRQDTIYLRSVIEKKLKWLGNEEKKAIVLIESLGNKRKMVATQLAKIKGAIIILNEILNEKKKE